MKGVFAAFMLGTALMLPAGQAAAEPLPGYITGNVNLRTGPGTGYPRVTTLPVGAAVVIEGCLAGWTWCDVAYGDLRGWVAGSYVASDYEGQRVRVVDYGPQLALPIVTFTLGTYWDRYYRGRPWYAHRARWAHYHPRYAAPRYVVPRPHAAYRHVYRPHRAYRHVDRHWDHRPHYRPPPRVHSRHERRHWDRGPTRYHAPARHHAPRGYGRGQTQRDAARFNRHRRGPMRGE
jgi:uncharacterized protein YraI